MFALPDQSRGRSVLRALAESTCLAEVVMFVALTESKSCVWVQRSKQTGVWRWSRATLACKCLLATSCCCRLFHVRCMFWGCGQVPVRERCNGTGGRYRWAR